MGAGLVISGLSVAIVGMTPVIAAGMSQNFATFGIFILGFGVSMILTQIFNEKYEVKHPLGTFAGTLAAVWLVMWMASQFLFKDDPNEGVPRDLELVVICPPSPNFQSASQLQPLLVVEGEKADILQDIQAATQKYGTPIQLSDAELGLYHHVGGALKLKPLRYMVNNPEIEFLLPAAVLPGNDLEISVVTAEPRGQRTGGVDSQTDDAQSFKILGIDIKRDTPSPTKRGTIRATVDFGNFKRVCGADS